MGAAFGVMDSSLKQSHPQIQVGDLVAICAKDGYDAIKSRGIGLVIEVTPLFYREPQTWDRKTFEPVRTDRLRVLWTSGIKTYEPAGCLTSVSKIKR